MKTLIIGFDSAWTARKKGAMVAVITQLDAQTNTHKYKMLQLPVTVDWAGAHEHVRIWIDSHSPDSTRIYIDQPTIVKNTTGQRPVENIVSSLISYHYGGMQSSSLKRDDMFGPSAPITGFINALNADVQMDVSSAPVRVIETYPALSIIAKGWLNSSEGSARSRLPKYNPDNRRNFSPDDWQRLCQHLADDFKYKGLGDLNDYLIALQGLTNPKKYNQDALDACLCLMAGLEDINGEAMSSGHSDSGFIVVSYGEAAYQRLEARCVATGRDPSAWLQYDEQQMTCKQGSLDDVVQVMQAVQEIQNQNLIQSILDRVSAKRYLALVAYQGNQPMGCKLGYVLNADTFYSWLGGVIPTQRGKGVAQQLLNEQEAWAREVGFKYLHVKSMNRYPAMLHMLIKNRYQVCGYEDKGTVEESKVCFAKILV